MNPVTRWFVGNKIKSVVKAERFTGHRTQICVGIYLLAFCIQFTALQFGGSVELIDAMDWLKELALGLGGLALAAKITRSGPEGTPQPK